MKIQKWRSLKKGGVKSRVWRRPTRSDNARAGNWGVWIASQVLESAKQTKQLKIKRKRQQKEQQKKENNKSKE